MLGLPLPSKDPLQILCLGAHADDIEIGCGATLLELAERHRIDVRWVVFSASGERRAEAEAAADVFLENAAHRSVEIHDFPDGRFPMVRGELKEEFDRLRDGLAPHLVLAHDEMDLHQDHALLGRLTRETFRDHLILGYEIPKYDGGLRSPNVFVPVEEATARRKARIILDEFGSQRQKHWLDEETLSGLMRLRGVECASPSRYAEGFHGSKLQIAL